MNNEKLRSSFITSAPGNRMCSLVAACLVLGASAMYGDDLETLKISARRYVAAMKATLAPPEESDCSETIAKADQYAAAKVTYYGAARQAMPALLQIAKGQGMESRYGEELTESFHGFGEDKDEEINQILKAKLSRCPGSANRDAALTAMERARQIAEQFGRLEGA